MYEDTETYKDYVKFAEKHVGKHGRTVGRGRINFTWYADGTVVEEIDKINNNGETYIPEEIRVSKWDEGRIQKIEFDKKEKTNKN